MLITSLSQLDPNGTYSYADYITWQLNEVVELLRGKIVKMSPAPSTKHQLISSELQGIFWTYFRHKKCKVFAAPFDVRLYDRKKSLKKNQDIFTVVQPDLCVICDLEKLDSAGCNGSPDLIIEILSKGNSKKEIQTKYELYQEAGVREYWVVLPEFEWVQIFVLEESSGLFRMFKTFEKDDLAYSAIFPELQVDLLELFAE